MAELFARKIMADTPDVIVDSAGIRGLPGHPIDSTAASLLKRDGIHVEDFRSKRVDGTIVHQADLILCFARNHRSEIAIQYPTALKKSFLLDEYTALADYHQRNTMIDARSSTADNLHDIMENATMIKPLIPTAQDIKDPHGLSLETFTQVYDHIKADLTQIARISKAAQAGR